MRELPERPAAEVAVLPLVTVTVVAAGPTALGLSAFAERDAG